MNNVAGILLQAFDEYGMDMDYRDKVQFLLELRDYLYNGNGIVVARKIDEWLHDREERIYEEGICPHCGSELEFDIWELSPSGNLRRERYCPKCESTRR